MIDTGAPAPLIRSIFTVAVGESDVEFQVTGCELPAGKLSPPLGDVTAIVGGVA